MSMSDRSARSSRLLLISAEDRRGLVRDTFGLLQYGTPAGCARARVDTPRGHRRYQKPTRSYHFLAQRHGKGTVGPFNAASFSFA